MEPGILDEILEERKRHQVKTKEIWKSYDLLCVNIGSLIGANISDVSNRGNCVCVGGAGIYMSSSVSAQFFFYESKSIPPKQYIDKNPVLNQAQL